MKTEINELEIDMDPADYNSGYNKNEGESVFPGGTYNNLTKLEYFTASALQGIVNNIVWKDINYDRIANTAVLVAIKTLAEIKKFEN